MMQKCPNCKKETLKLVGFNKTVGKVYLKCFGCGHSEERYTSFSKIEETPWSFRIVKRQ